MNEINKKQIESIIISAVLVCLGVLFIVLKAEMLGVIETIICFALLGFGVIEIMIYCFLNTENRDYSKLIVGAVATVLALLLIFVSVLFVIILGALVAISGVLYVKKAIQDKKAGDKNWWGMLVIGILVFALGLSVAILYNLESLKNLIMILFGITLIFEGVSRFMLTFVFNKELKLFVSFVKTNSKSETQESIEPEYTIINNAEEKMQKSQKNIEKIVKNNENIKDTEDSHLKTVGFADQNNDESNNNLDDDFGDDGFV